MVIFWEYAKIAGHWIFDNIIYFNMLCSIIIVFFQRRNPKSVWGWLLVLYFVPIFGFLLFLVFGQDMHRSKMFKMKEIEDEVNYIIHKQEESILRRDFDMQNVAIANYTDLILYNLESSSAVFTDNNKVTIYTDGKKKFQALMDELKKAKQYIHIEYYIIRNDEVFDEMKKVLCEKAREGVEVRILYDSMGCMQIRKKVWRELERAGIHSAEFFPALFKRLHLRINYRNHRKIVVIDGKSAFVGGFNIGREYLGLSKRFGYWRDTHLKISGSAVQYLQLRFLLDWNYSAKENLLRKRQYVIMPEEVELGKSGVQIVSSGPDSSHKNIRNNYLKLFNNAKKSIYIQTPYFVPDESIFDALRMSALSGVDVRLMIPCKPDHPFVYWATYSYVGDMIEAGVKCYTYDNGFLHAKGVVVDQNVICYGTANMDIRSFELNFEVNATIYDTLLATQMHEIFIEDLKNCTEITASRYQHRKFMVRIKEQVSRLFSPVL